ncbi:MAG: hypothetical protein ACOYKG_00780 [Ilumatobacteraceae bacterium]|jgi:hypothetical protein
MFLWFIGTAIISVLFVFRDDRFDYRVLALGALLPDLIDVLTGGAWVFHSVLGSVIALGLVMTFARRGTAARRMSLAIPIGMFMHLVFDGAFNNTKVFWWPFAGFNFGGASIPSFDRIALDVLLEIAGAAMLMWVWRTNNLSDPDARHAFFRTGRLVLEKK